ncbi:beta-propeller fold lactonase family protein [Alkalihalobacillus sp. R86527]|uniref:beta-propeller fold lactonase family protein n=1 Tax=Alkalihalobacillus sp. R86527 TaxID=3093863 RepID=UPI00366D1FDA
MVTVVFDGTTTAIEITFLSFDPRTGMVTSLRDGNTFLFCCRDAVGFNFPVPPPRLPIGIVTEFNSNRFTIFDTDTLTILEQIDNPALDYIDVAITRDCKSAALTAFNSQSVVQLDLTQDPPQVVDVVATPLNAEDVDMTPDNRFAAIVDGGGVQGIVSYGLADQAIVNAIPGLSLQAVAVSQTGNGLVLGADFFGNQIRVLSIDSAGIIVDTGTTVNTGGNGPINITFHPSGKFAFVANLRSNDIAVFDTTNPTLPVLLTNIPTSTNPQTIVVSKNGKNVFVLTASGGAVVTEYAFTPSAPFLTPVQSFSTGLGTSAYFGVDQMALDVTQKKLLVSASASQVLAAFGTDGTSLGTIPGVLANGGVATCLR